MINKVFIIWVLLIAPLASQASFVSYDAMDAFHRSKVESISAEYNLQNRAKITFSLLPSGKIKKADNTIVKLPGLLLDAVSLNSVKEEVGLVEIMDALKSYNRKFVILQSSRMSDKEVAIIKQALQDELFVKEKEAVSVKPWSTQQVWHEDLKTSFRDQILTSPMAYVGLVIFCILSFLIFGLSSSILNGFKHVGKSIYDSVENSVGTGSPSAGHASEEETAGGKASGTSQFEIVDSEIDYANDDGVDCFAILVLITKVVVTKPNEFKMKMWELFPSVESQLSLYINFETELQVDQMETFKSLFDEVFNLSSSMNHSSSEGAPGQNVQSALWKLRLGLTRMLVMPADETREKMLGSVVKNYRGQADKIITGSLKSHYKILNYLFPQKVDFLVNKFDSFDDGFSDQILSFATSEEHEKMPTDLDLRNFENHLIECDYFVEEDVALEKEKDLELLSRLPDHVLSSNNRFTGEIVERFNQSIPNLNWIDTTDSKTNKKFVLSLTADEAAHFIEHFNQIEAFKESLNSRTVSRLQEMKIKSSSPNSVKSVLGLRKKIGMFYTGKVTEQIEHVENAA